MDVHHLDGRTISPNLTSLHVSTWHNLYLDTLNRQDKLYCIVTQHMRVSICILTCRTTCEPIGSGHCIHLYGKMVDSVAGWATWFPISTANDIVLLVWALRLFSSSTLMLFDGLILFHILVGVTSLRMLLDPDPISKTTVGEANVGVYFVISFRHYGNVFLLYFSSNTSPWSLKKSNVD